MSAKWVRSKQFDDRFFPSWAWPAKFLLRTFSSIPLAVVLLTLVVVYSTLASVPIGLLALGITYFIYLLTILLSIFLVGILPVLILRRLWNPPQPSTLRFITSLAAVILLTLAAVELWTLFLWPRLHYDAATHSGFRLFGSFVDAYRSTTLRRLPGFEMSEPEFYSWWPLRLILALFVINMITATVRRIEFTFPNLGVLTVHTGIVTIALGSMYYRGLKIEGDTLLISGAPGPDGAPTPGPIQDRFYDNQATALWINQNSQLWDQRPIQPPRYNDYGLISAGFPTAKSTVAQLDFSADRGRTLNEPIKPLSSSSKPIIDPDLRFAIVGYASYANLTNDWVRAELPAPPEKPNPIRFIELRAKNPDPTGEDSFFAFYLAPDRPAHRISETGGTLAIEVTHNMPESRWKCLTETLPPQTRHALVVEIPQPDNAPPLRTVLPIAKDQTQSFGGYTLTVKDISPKPPFPIITEGYKGASSSVAVIRITTPDGKSFDRWCYHRFPEIAQDMLDELNDRGMPKRRDADPAISLTYIDASQIQFYIDERDDGTLRAAIRFPTGALRTEDNLKTGSVLDEVIPRRVEQNDPIISLAIGPRWDHAVSIERPQVVPESQRDKSDVGTHIHALLAVEVSSITASWKKTIWLPFTRFHNAESDKHRDLTLPDGRQITLAFGRLAHRFPNFFLQLTNFEMIAYDHRGSPRDYQSVIRVIPAHESAETMSFKPYEHVTRLNAPLQAPFIWSDDRSYLANVWGTLRSRLDARQFKLSQAGWDAEGWRRTQEMTDRGELSRPFASFTILGVGNNPGIHIIALGGILMSVGIPWAFYLKPVILHRRKLKIQKQLAAGTYQRPDVSRGVPAPVPATPTAQQSAGAHP